MKLALLNSAILTTYGTYAYQPCTAEAAQEAAQDAYLSDGLESYIGHQSTADFLSILLDVPVPYNRAQYTQGVEERALVFKLKIRSPEGTVLSREEVEALPCEFGFLVRFS